MIQPEGDKTYKQVHKDIDSILQFASGNIITFVFLDREFNYKSRAAKRYRWQVLEEYVKKGIAVKKATGKYLILNGELEEVDWQSADTKNVMEVAWPLELERFIKTYHKTVAIIAGDPSSGKTAFCDNFVIRNMNHPAGIVMFSNDMTAEEVAERMINSGVSIPNPAPFRIWQAYSDFQLHKEFRPDGINVIDYLDLNSEVYLIGEEIEKVYRKLNRGMALIAIQKKPGQKIGIGGVFSLKRPKIYFSLGVVTDSGELYHKLTIEKCRGRVTPKVNPRGMEFKFKLIGGIKFWMKEEG